MTAPFRVFTLSPQAIAQAGRMGLPQSEVVRMARSAARCTHPHGNWRYDGYVLRIEADTVQSIRPHQPR